jgi:membrane-associated PAP2 superfamily phosphatase
MLQPVTARGSFCSRPFVYVLTHVLGISLLLAICAAAVQYSNIDMSVARVFFDSEAHAFPLRNSRVLEMLGHHAVLALPVGVAIAALGGALASYRFAILRPWRAVLWGIALTCGLGQVAITQLKHHTALPRPYDLSMFGGYAAYPAKFWAAARRDAGGALPSGHAGAGYALLCLYFAGWAAGRPAWRWGGLVVGIAAGILFSAVRITQGAHFLSQTLWSACVMWCLASVLFYPAIARSRNGTRAVAQPARGGSTQASMAARRARS